jgi:DNA-binding CsgD family transcriptional regulator
VLGASGQRAHALKQLGQAQNLFLRIGAPRFADRAAKAQRQLGHRVGGSRRPDGIDSLTGRETEIARLVADGRTNRQIAGKLVLSERTVEAHLRNIRAKLDAPTRTAVAAALARADA